MQTTGELLSLAELFALLRVRRTKGYEFLKIPGFPLAFALDDGNARVWDKAEILAWVASRPRRQPASEPEQLRARRFRDGRLIAPRKSQRGTP